MNREPIATVAALDTLDDAEIIAGYHSGLDGDDEPGGNHSLSYWHGWRNGVADRTGATDDAQRRLAREYLTTRASADPGA